MLKSTALFSLLLLLSGCQQVGTKPNDQDLATQTSQCSADLHDNYTRGLNLWAAHDYQAAEVLLACTTNTTKNPDYATFQQALQQAHNIFPAIDALDDIQNPNNQALFERQHPRLATALASYRRLLKLKAAQSNHDDVISATDFAAQLQTQTANIDELQPFIHPEIGLFIIHNLNGDIAQLDHLSHWPTDTWPEDGYDYSTFINVAQLLDRMQHATQWLTQASSSDHSGNCPPQASNQITTAEGDSFYAWSIKLGMDHSLIPDRYRLQSWEDLQANLDREISATALSALQRASLASTHSIVIDGDHYHFGRIGSRWFLLSINIITSGCG